MNAPISFNGLKEKLSVQEGEPYHETAAARIIAFRNGWDACLNEVLKVLRENYEACKNLTEEDKVRSAQDIVNETYEDLIEIFT